MEYIIGAVILAVAVYMLSREKKEKPPIEPPIEKEDKKEVIVKPLPTEQKVYWVKDGKKEWGIAKHMPQGLQVFEGKGNCILDVTDSLCRLLGSFPANTKSGEVTINLDSGRLFCYSITETYQETPIVIKVEGNKIIWNYGDYHAYNIYGLDENTFNRRIYYGSY